MTYPAPDNLRRAAGRAPVAPMPAPTAGEPVPSEQDPHPWIGKLP